MDDIVTAHTLPFWKAISSQVTIASTICSAECNSPFASSSSFSDTGAGRQLRDDRQVVAARRAKALAAVEKLVYFLNDDKLSFDVCEGEEPLGSVAAVSQELKSVSQQLKSARLDFDFERLTAYRKLKVALEKVVDFAEKAVASSYRSLLAPIKNCATELQQIVQSLHKDVDMKELVLLMTSLCERIQTMHILLSELQRQLHNSSRAQSAQTQLFLLRRSLQPLNTSLQLAVHSPSSQQAAANKQQLLQRLAALLQSLLEALAVSDEELSSTRSVFIECGHFVLNVDELLANLHPDSRATARPPKLERLANSFLRHVSAVCELLPGHSCATVQAAAKLFEDSADTVLFLLTSADYNDSSAGGQRLELDAAADSAIDAAKEIEALINQGLVSLLVHSLSDVTVPLEMLAACLLQPDVIDESEINASRHFAEFLEKCNLMGKIVKFAAASCDNPKDIKEIANAARDCDRMQAEITAAVSPPASAIDSEPQLLVSLTSNWTRAVVHLICVMDRVMDPQLLLEFNEDAMHTAQSELTSNPLHRDTAIACCIRGGIIGRRACEAANRLWPPHSTTGAKKLLLRQLLRASSLLRHLLPNLVEASPKERWMDEARFRIDLCVKCLRNLRAACRGQHEGEGEREEEEELALTHLLREAAQQQQQQQQQQQHGVGNDFLSLPILHHHRGVDTVDAVGQFKDASPRPMAELHPLAARLVAMATEADTTGVALVNNDVSQLSSFLLATARQMAAADADRTQRLQRLADTVTNDAAQLVARATAASQSEAPASGISGAAGSWSIGVRAVADEIAALCCCWLCADTRSSDKRQQAIDCEAQLQHAADELRCCSKFSNSSFTSSLLSIQASQRALEAALAALLPVIYSEEDDLKPSTRWLNFSATAWCLCGQMRRLLRMSQAPEPALLLADFALIGSPPANQLHGMLRSLITGVESDATSLKSTLASLAAAEPAAAAARSQLSDIVAELNSVARATREAAGAFVDQEIASLQRCAALRLCALTAAGVVLTSSGIQEAQQQLQPSAQILTPLLQVATSRRSSSERHQLIDKQLASFTSDFGRFLTLALQQQQPELLEAALLALQSLGLEVEALRSELSDAVAGEVGAGQLRQLLLQKCECAAAVQRLLRLLHSAAEPAMCRDTESWLHSYFSYEGSSQDAAVLQRRLAELSCQQQQQQHSTNDKIGYRDARLEIEGRIRSRVAAGAARQRAAQELQEQQQLQQQQQSAADGIALAARQLQQQLGQWAEQDNPIVKAISTVGDKLAAFMRCLHGDTSIYSDARSMCKDAESICNWVTEVNKFADIVSRLCRNKESSQSLREASQRLHLPSAQLSMLTKSLQSPRQLQHKQKQLLPVVQSLLAAASDLLRQVEACSIAGVDMPDDSGGGADAGERAAALLACSWHGRLQAFQQEVCSSVPAGNWGLRAAPPLAAVPSLADLLCSAAADVGVE